MTIIKRDFLRGIRLVPDNTALVGNEGEVKVDLSGKLLAYLQSAQREIATLDQTQTLTNKTIDADNNTISNLETDNLKAGVLNTSTTLATASNTQIPSALAVKTYVDTGLAGQNDANEITYNNTTSGLTATNVQDAIDEIDQDIDDLNTLTGVAKNSTTLGTFTGTTIPDNQTIKASLQSLETGLEAHLVDAVDAHDASAISNVPSGNLAATDVQSALNELQSDTDGRTAGPASATDEAVARYDGTTGKLLQNSVVRIGDTGVITGAIQADIANLRISTNDIVSTNTDGNINLDPDGNGLVRSVGNHQVTGTLSANDVLATSQVSGATVTGTTSVTAANVLISGNTITSTNTDGALNLSANGSGNVVVNDNLDVTGTSSVQALGATFLSVDNITIDGNTISSNNTNGNIVLDANGTGIIQINDGVTISGTLDANGLVQYASANDNTSGTAVTLATPTTKVIRLTNASLVSVAGIPASVDAREYIIENVTGNAVTFINSATLLTGTGADLSLANDASIVVSYDSTSSAHRIIGGSGSGGSSATPTPADVDILYTQNAETADLGDFTQTGLEILTSGPVLHDTASFRLIHQAASTYSFKEVISVPRKFRGQSVTLNLTERSTATDGNLTLLIYDETNAANIAASQSIQTSSVAIASLTTTISSTSVTGFTTANINTIYVGSSVTGTGIASGTTVSAINTSTNTITLSANATASGTVTLRFSPLPAVRTFSFTIPNSCASMSYTISALAESGSPESYIDDLQFKLTQTALTSTSVVVPNMTDWASYVPTFTGFGTPSSVEFEYRQVGSNYEIRGKFTSGTTTATEARISLPNGATSAGTSIIPSITRTGDLRRVAGAAANGFDVLIEPSVTYMTFGLFTNASSVLTKRNGTDFGSSEVQVLTATIPIASLSATTTKTIQLTQSGFTTSPDSMVRVQQTNGYGSTATKITRFSNLIQSVGSDILYTDSATNGASFTVLTDGVYLISYSASMSSAQSLGLSKNSTQLTTDIVSITAADRLIVETSDTTDRPVSVSWQGYLVANDVIRPHGQGSGFSTNANGHFTITKQNAIKQVNVSSDQKITIPTSELRFEGASARGGTDTNITKFDTQAKIRGNSFSVVNTAANGTVVTILKAGRLSVSASVGMASGESIWLTKNQAVLTTTPVASEILATSSPGTGAKANVSWTGDISGGDIIRINTSTSPTAGVNNNLNLSFQEQQVSVSVSNTLPQFSQSDSSVRVDTANGYGSTATKIRRFSNTRYNIGTDVEYTDSATNGASFKAVTDGIYHISFTDNFTAVGQLGISLNSSELTTDIDTITAPTRLTMEYTGGAGQPANASWQGYLLAGDVIRAHTDGVAALNNSRTSFTMTKVGRPNVTGVDVTPFVNIPQNDTEYIEYTGSNISTFGSTNTGVPFFTPTKNTNKGIIRVNSDSVNGTNFEILKKCNLTIAGVASAAGANATLYITRNSTTLTATGISDYLSSAGITASTGTPVVASIIANVGDIIRFQRNSTSLSGINGISLTATAESDNIVTPLQTFSSDTASFAYSSTLTSTTLVDAAIGSFITYRYATGSSNTRTQSSSAPTQTTSDMNINGLRIYARAYNATSTDALPAVFMIQIGKGLAACDVKLFKNTTSPRTSGKVPVDIVGTTKYGLSHSSYDPTTGILTLDGGYDPEGVSTTGTLTFADNTLQTNGYITISASKSPALTGVPLVQPRIATISDVKSSGTDAGTATSGSYATRTLNTIEDPTGIITSLASNQWVLPKGTYYIEAYAPAYQVNFHKAKIRNITLGTDLILSKNAYNNSGDAVMTFAELKGTITLTTATTLELQHRVSATKAANGLGLASGSFGDTEQYSMVKIQKIKD